MTALAVTAVVVGFAGALALTGEPVLGRPQPDDLWLVLVPLTGGAGSGAEERRGPVARHGSQGKNATLEIEDESATGRATLYVVLTRATQRLTTVS